MLVEMTQYDITRQYNWGGSMVRLDFETKSGNRVNKGSSRVIGIDKYRYRSIQVSIHLVSINTGIDKYMIVGGAPPEPPLPFR